MGLTRAARPGVIPVRLLFPLMVSSRKSFPDCNNLGLANCKPKTLDIIPFAGRQAFRTSSKNQTHDRVAIYSHYENLRSSFLLTESVSDCPQRFGAALYRPASG